MPRVRDLRRNYLTAQEAAMRRALLRDEKDIVTLRWRYSSAHDLLGRKTVDRLSGGSVIVFELVERDGKETLNKEA